MQAKELENTPDFIVATTGRLLDHLQNTKNFTLDHIDVLVLDEADRLIELGFQDAVKHIVTHCQKNNPKLHTLMFSATLNQDLKELATIALHEPIRISTDQQLNSGEGANLKLASYLIRVATEEGESEIAALL